MIQTTLLQEHVPLGEADYRLHNRMCKHTLLYIYIYIRTYMYIHICEYVYVYMCIYIYIYIYIHGRTSRRSPPRRPRRRAARVQ